jgi:hypothetical protein
MASRGSALARNARERGNDEHNGKVRGHANRCFRMVYGFNCRTKDYWRRKRFSVYIVLAVSGSGPNIIGGEG